MRQRNVGESLRALYQDVRHLLMLAYPGPQNDLRDQLAVEAFVDSLDDAELEVRVKDHFPATLAEAFQTALRLEANRPKLKRQEENTVERERSAEAKQKSRRRDDLETRQVNFEDESNVESRLKRMERDMRDAREQSADEARVNRLESKVQTLELQK